MPWSCMGPPMRAPLLKAQGGGDVRSVHLSSLECRGPAWCMPASPVCPKTLLVHLRTPHLAWLALGLAASHQQPSKLVDVESRLASIASCGDLVWELLPPPGPDGLWRLSLPLLPAVVPYRAPSWCARPNASAERDAPRGTERPGAVRLCVTTQLAATSGQRSEHRTISLALGAATRFLKPRC